MFRNIRSDVIAVWGDSDLSVLDNRIEHSIDDCISFHSQNGVDAWLLRRNIDVEDNQCFDTQSITGSGAIYTVVSHNQLISPKGAGLIFGTDGANGGDNQGQNTSASVIISYNLITNAMNRAMVDNYDQDDECMLFYAGAARKGQYLAPPGEGGVAGLTAPVYPYPEFFAQAESTSVAVGDSRAYVISNNSCVHDFPTFNNSDTRYKDYTAFGQGQILTTTGWVTLSTDESIFRVFGMYFSGGDMRDVLIKDNTFQGLDSALLIQNSGNYYKFEIANNRIIDMSTRGFGLFNNGKTNIYIHDNVLDLDPWWRDSRTAAGGWNNEDRIALQVGSTSGNSIIYKANLTYNAGADTNCDPTSPTCGVYFQDNLDFGDLSGSGAAVNSFNQYNAGVGLVHNSGFRLITVDSAVADTAFESFKSVPVQAAAAEPTAGCYMQGDYVKDSAPVAAVSGTPTIRGWLRLTTSCNDNTTDWQVDHAQ